jgi:hypothetical protein
MRGNATQRDMLAVVFVAAVPLGPIVRRTPIGAEQGIAGE